MARRLLGPEGPISMFDQGGVFEPQPVQPVSPEGRYTGGLWGRRHTQSDERGDEEAAIQEKCYVPRFLQIPADLSVEEGRFCRIDFKVGGLPMPDVTWYLDGEAVRPDDFHKMLVCEKGMHSLILEITTMRDAGVYECVARNRAGESRFTMRLNVIAQEVLQPPTFVQKLLNSRALEGDTVSLECKIYASPTPQVFWKKDKEMLHIDPSRMSLYQDGSGRHRLLIEWVRKSDAGWYTLSAINVAGMSSCNARLDIGTATTLPIKPVAPASKLLKLPSGSRAQVASVESFPRRPALPYESEELLPKPTLKKPVTPRPSSSRSTDEDIQGSKDALIQDLEKKLRTKEARRRISQKLSYEERMARRLLGPEGPISMFDQGGVFEPQPVQPVSPEGRYTGGLW
eukprot:XP_011616439.1 PREDICTED: myotilin [Takifugu rubripes]